MTYTAMKSALLFCFLLLVVRSYGSNPSMRHLLAINTNGWPTTGSCSTTPDPTKDCDRIVDVYTGNTGTATAAVKMQAKMLEISGKLIAGETTYASVKPDLCTAATAYRTCVDNTEKNCGGSIKSKVKAKQKSVHLLSKFLENNVCKKNDIENKLKSFDFKTCYSSGGLSAADAKKRVEAAIGQLKTSRECSAAAKAAKKIMSFYNSAKDACKDKIGPMTNFVARLFVRPDRKCNDKKFKDKPSAADRGNPKEKERVSAQFIAMNTHLLGVTNFKTAVKNYITCADETTTRQQAMFAWDFFSVDCDLSPQSDNNMPNTQCRKACVTVSDDQYNEVAKVCLEANKSFEKEGRTIKKGKQKGGGKLNSDISIKPKGSNLLMVFDKNSGTMVFVRRTSYKVQRTGDKHYLLIITVRTTKSVLAASSGRLAQACDDVKDIAAAIAAAAGRRRKKRATASQIQNYNKATSGDNTIAFMNEASSDASAAQEEDSNFSSAGRVSSSVLLLALTISMAVWTM